MVEMSATARGREDAFGLEAEDYQCPLLKARLEAEKVAELKEAIDLERVAAAEALKLAESGAGVVGVVMNTVASAREVFEALPKGEAKILLTGRVRPYDRDRLVERHLDRMKAGRTRNGGMAFFVVGTQTVEVGADLGFDGLVSEAAPLGAR